MKRTRIGFVVACVVLSAFAASVRADPPPPTLWASQVGSSDTDLAQGIAIDVSGNIYVAGHTYGDLGAANQGWEDAFVVKCDASGAAQWVRQFGTTDRERAHGVAVDGGGNSYVTGYTSGNLGPGNQGLQDAFVVKCDAGGAVQWVRQFGTSTYDIGYAIAVDGGGNSYVAGHTEGDLGGPNQGGSDAFIVKYDSGGTQQWARQVGSSSHDSGRGIAVDGSGNSYMTGYTWGDLGDPSLGKVDAFIVKYDAAGMFQWARLIGTSCPNAGNGIAVDGAGNIYVTGTTAGDLGGPNQGMGDAFVVKCDSAGTVQWAGQFGTSGYDVGCGIAVDGSGNSYISGTTEVNPQFPLGPCDGLVAKYDAEGAVQWIRRIGTGWPDRLVGVALDGGGMVHVGGDTVGDLGGPNQGGWGDVFVAALAPYPATYGDATLDGCVDGLDYIVWSVNYQQTDQWWEEGDFTGEGYVDGLDYILWSNNYRAGCPAAVPEPACAALLALGICALRRRRPA